MSDPTDAATETGQEAQELDTTDGRRDPLTTDDGLAEAAEGIPQIDDRVAQGPGRDDDKDFDQQDPVGAPGLEVDGDGVDPLAGEGDEEPDDDGQVD